MVNAFEYFDKRNSDRINNVKEKLVGQKKNLANVHEIMELVKKKIQKNEDIFLQINAQGKNGKPKKSSDSSSSSSSPSSNNSKEEVK